jgi:hypothetical protein
MRTSQTRNSRAATATRKFHYFQLRLMDTFTSWRKGLYHALFSTAAAHCKPQREGRLRVLRMKGGGERKKSGKRRFVMIPSAARIFPNPRLSTRPTIQELHPTQKTKDRFLADDICNTQRCSHLMDLFCNKCIPLRREMKKGRNIQYSSKKSLVFT